jgi:hypothetical protein
MLENIVDTDESVTSSARGAIFVWCCLRNASVRDGIISRLPLTPLNLAEEYPISRSVLLVSLIKLNTSVTGVPKTAKRGHIIPASRSGRSSGSRFRAEIKTNYVTP